jgi:hypothetical protein
MTRSPYDQPYVPPRKAAVAPVWVRVGLAGVRTRAQAIGWLVASAVGAALVGVLIAIATAVALGVGILASAAAGVASAAVCSLATLWYWLAVRWMDANDGWAGR